MMMILLSSTVFAGSSIFTISDIEGDATSNNDGTIETVNLDLVSLSAESRGNATVFKATFAKPIEAPDNRVISQSGATLQSFAPNGFYTFNLDVYINRNGGGDVNDLNGGSPFAWEKVICLNPRPHAAKMTLREEMKRRALQEVIAKNGSYTSADEQEVQQRIKAQIDEHIYFPTLIRVHGSTIEFTVPHSFLDQTADSNWNYAAGVTRSAVADYINQTKSRPQASLQAEYNDVMKLPSLLVQENLLMQPREAYVDLIVSADLQTENK
jgi:hypothetical protein